MVSKSNLKKLLTSAYWLALLINQLHRVKAHGRLLEPPARNTLWRLGYKAPANYNDNELFCGGIGQPTDSSPSSTRNQGIARNEGLCGICGDPYDGPRLHESGQPMAKNVTSRSYFPGSSVDLMVEIVANHGGEFRFDMCWREEWSTKETENCFEPLSLSDGGFEYWLDPAQGNTIFTLSLDLPENRTCDRCILRWQWRASNSWGRCEDGTEGLGCGFQEVWRNCADVSVNQLGTGIGSGLRRRK